MTRILSLDDEPEMLDLIKLILARKNYHALTTHRNDEAWVILHTRPIDLFTQDLARPDLDGWMLLWMLKCDPVLRNLPVLGISAGPRDLRACQCRSIGLDFRSDLAGYLEKPFGPQELYYSIEAALEKRNPQWTADTPRMRWLGLHQQPLPVSIAALQAPDRDLRYEAAATLGWRRDHQVVEPLIHALEDQDWFVRAAAANSLGMLNDRRAVQPLIGRLQDQVSEVHQAAVLSLGKLGDPQAIEPLSMALQDQDWEKRHVAATALAQIKDDRAFHVLIQTLQDENADVAWSAAYALGWRADAGSLSALQRTALENTWPLQRDEALFEPVHQVIEQIIKTHQGRKPLAA